MHIDTLQIALSPTISLQSMNMGFYSVCAELSKLRLNILSSSQYYKERTLMSVNGFWGEEKTGCEVSYWL